MAADGEGAPLPPLAAGVDGIDGLLGLSGDEAMTLLVCGERIQQVLRGLLTRQGVAPPEP